MRKLRFLFIVLSLMWACSPLASSSDKGLAYHGKVVDAETGEPIEGAVVVVVWYKKPHVTMDGPTYFHNAKEVLTNGEGIFSIDSSPGIDWSPFTYVREEPRIVIFKPGYGPFPRAHVREMSIEQTKNRLLKEGAVIKLPRIKSKEELRKFTSPERLGLLSVVPYEQIPTLIKLLNVQANSVGLQPLPEPFEGGRKP